MRDDMKYIFTLLLLIFNLCFARICWDDSWEGQYHEYELTGPVAKIKNKTDITYYVNSQRYVTYFLQGPLAGKLHGEINGHNEDENQAILKILFAALRSEYKAHKKIIPKKA